MPSLQSPGKDAMSPSPAPSRRKFLARGAAVAAVPAVAALAGGALAEPASAGTLPDFAPIPPSALGPAVNAQRPPPPPPRPPPPPPPRVGPAGQRAGLFRRRGGKDPVLAHRRHLPGGL